MRGRGGDMVGAVMEEAGIRVRLAGAEARGCGVLAGRQFSIEGLGFEGECERAQAIVEAIPTSARALDAEGRCVLCRYDLSGIEAPLCPECGQDLEQLGKRNRTFRLDPPPSDPVMIQKIGALVGSLTLIPLVVVILILVTMLVVAGISGGFEVFTGSGG